MLMALQHTQVNPTLWSRIFAILVRIRLVTRFPHGGIVEGGMLRHCNFKLGLHEIAFNPKGWLVVEVPDLVEDGDQLFDVHKGMGCDLFSLFTFVLPANFRDSSRIYCFEWMWWRMTGVNPDFRVTGEMLLEPALILNGKAGAYGKA